MTTNPYRVAYDQAGIELSEIADQFAQLSLRRDQIENLVKAFRPLVEPGGASSDQLFSDQPGHSSTQELSAPAYSFAEAPNSTTPREETNNDPFQSRSRGAYRFRGIG